MLEAQTRHNYAYLGSFAIFKCTLDHADLY